MWHEVIDCSQKWRVQCILFLQTACPVHFIPPNGVSSAFSNGVSSAFSKRRVRCILFLQTERYRMSGQLRVSGQQTCSLCQGAFLSATSSCMSRSSGPQECSWYSTPYSSNCKQIDATFGTGSKKDLSDLPYEVQLAQQPVLRLQANR